MSSIPDEKKLSFSSSSPQPEKSGSFALSENTTTSSFNKNSPKTTDQTGYEEMSKMVRTLMENSANQEKKIKEATKKNDKLKEEVSKLKAENVENISYKDKFNDAMFTYSLKEKEISNLKSKLKRRNAEIEKLKVENSKIEAMNKEIAEKDRIKEMIQNELTYLKNLPKDEKILSAERRTIQAQKQKEKFEKELKGKIELYNQSMIDFAKNKEAFSSYIKEKDEERIEMRKKIEQNEEDKIKMRNQLLQYTNIYIEIQSRYENSMAMINKIVTDSKALIKENQQQKEEYLKLKQTIDEKAKLATLSKVTPEQFKDIYSENISLISTKELFLSFQDIINSILTHFNTILPKCFEEQNDPNVSLSIDKQILKDIFYLLYSRILDSKNSHNKFLPLNVTQFSSEVVDQVALEIYNKNQQLSNTKICEKEITEQLLAKLSGLKLGDDLEKEIQVLFTKKVERDKELLLNGIKNVLSKCIGSIRDGNIVLNTKKLFSFSSFYGEGALISKGGLFVDNSKMTNYTVENVINLIKYPKEKILKVQFSGNFLYENITEEKILKIFNAIMMYTPNILCFSLTSCTNISLSIIAYLLFIIKNLKSLRVLNLENNNLQDVHLKMISKELKDNKSIVALLLTKNNFESSGGMYLAELLSKNQVIDKLFLGYNNITSSGLSALLEVISTGHEISILDLSNNKLVNEDFIEIAQFMTKNPKMVSMNLSGNKMELADAVELGVVLPNVKSIRTLNLSNMNIISDTSPVLFKALDVEEIIVDDNPLEEIGIIMFSKALSASQRVKKISLKNTNLSTIGLTHLFNSLKNNKGISEIHIENNSIDESGFMIAATFTKGKSIKVYMTKSYVNCDKIFDQETFGENVILV